MNNTKVNIIAGVGIVLAVIFGVSYLKPTTVEVINEVNVPPQEESQSYGAVSTLNDVDFPYVTIGGSEYYYYSKPIAATSSVFCSLKNPFAPSTSTPLNIGTRITGTIVGATSYDIATGTGQYQSNGSSTPAFAYAHSVGAGKQNNYEWIPRQIGSTSTEFKDTTLALTDVEDAPYPFFIAGNEYLNWKIASVTPGTDYYEGRCSALLKKN